jgi:16S rRNA (cytidine1402-2'-O)-methyltransferase
MLDSHGLYIVATPIGNLHDMTPRAVEVLKLVDVIAAEDTRHSSKLLHHFNITTPVISYHEHNEKTASDILLSYLAEGKKVALISDAGTPLISDPGFQLVRQARAAGYRVIPVPGASALIAALSVSGLPTHRFIFEGFLPAKSQARKEKLKTCVNETGTVIFYESPHRILNSLEDMQTVLGEDRYVVLARELTKTYESVYGAVLSELIAWIHEDQNRQRGEFVLLIHPAQTSATKQEITSATQDTLDILLAELSVKQAVNLAAKITRVNKNLLYSYALSKEESKKSPE